MYSTFGWLPAIHPLCLPLCVSLHSDLPKWPNGESKICTGTCFCKIMGRAPPLPPGVARKVVKISRTNPLILFAAMSHSSATDTFSPSPASGRTSASASSASGPDDFFDMEEINVDGVPVEERPDYVLRAELPRAITLLCFTPPKPAAMCNHT